MALQQPICLYPNNDSVDPSTALTFQWQVKGSSRCVAYQELILDLSNSAVYTGTKTTLPTPLFGDAILEIPFAISGTNCVVGNTYKHKILMYYNATEFVTSGEIPFKASTTPTLSINMPALEPYDSQMFDFTLNFVQAQNTKIKYYQYWLYDANIVQKKTTDKVYRSDTTYSVDGFINNQKYFIQAYVETQDGVGIRSALEDFNISYDIVETVLSIDVSYNMAKNALEYSWGNAVQIIGVASSVDGYEFVDDFIYRDYKGIHILSGEYVSFTVDVPVTFTAHVDFKRLTTFTGDIINLVDADLNTYTLSFNGTNYVYTINGVGITYSPVALAGNYFHAVLFPTKAMLYPYNTGEVFLSDTLLPAEDLYMTIQDAPV